AAEPRLLDGLDLSGGGDPRFALAGEVAGRPVAVLFLLELRVLARADRELGDRTAGVETAAAGWVDRARDVAFQDHLLALPGRIRNRDRRNQRRGVGVLGLAVELLRGSHLHDPA